MAACDNSISIGNKAMNKSPLLFVKISTVLCGALAVAQFAKPASTQPAHDAAPLGQSIRPIEELKLTLNYKDIDAVELLQKVSTDGNLAIVVRGDVEGLVEEIHLNQVEPEYALEKVAEEAGLDWKLVDQVYIVSPRKTVKPTGKGRKISLRFENVDISALLNIIGQQFEVKLSVSPEVTGQLKYLQLKNRSPEDAITLICQAAGLVCQKEGDTYVVSKPNG
jgi:type II secretory pathway component HofQ